MKNHPNRRLPIVRAFELETRKELSPNPQGRTRFLVLWLKVVYPKMSLRAEIGLQGTIEHPEEVFRFVWQSPSMPAPLECSNVPTARRWFAEQRGHYIQELVRKGFLSL